MPAAQRCASAARYGRRIAASPPGSGTTARWANRENDEYPATKTSPPQIVPSSP
jgi:hypothetical protein